MYGPSIKSTQYGTAANISSSVSLIAFGLPGKLSIKLLPLIPAVQRDNMAVLTYFKLIDRIYSPKPGIIFSHTASVASGVTSRGAGPVPPVVTMKQHQHSSACNTNIYKKNIFSEVAILYLYSYKHLTNIRIY